ncbi:CaiB/BaiF CoA transferase family protein [Microbacterium aurantiacum]|uniref:CaiB/BaiF CoA transferase family protein n=1 Tax=Microbacterium aurantiacum TaxID=162393 RepID=UPI00341D4F30
MIDPAVLARAFDRPTHGPLAGVVVADFSRVLAGPYATMLLADMGALVVKVESPGGDDTRRWRPPVRGDESTYFLSVNRNKFALSLDFADAGDLAIAHRIVARADVMVENFRPGALARFGLDAASVRARHPSLIVASLTGFGSGAGAALPGYDLLAQAASGLMSVTGDPDGPPTKVGVAVVDVLAGLHAAVGILGALRARERDGEGQRVEVDLLTSALSGLVNQASAVIAAGASPGPLGNAHPSLAPYEPFATADGTLVIAVGNDRQFAQLCEALETPDLVEDARFATMPARNAHREILHTLLTEALRARPAAEWSARLRDAGVPCGPLNDIAGGIRMADELGLDPVVTAGPAENGVPTVRHPIRWSSGDLDYSKAPPERDADRDRILRWLAADSA